MRLFDRTEVLLSGLKRIQVDSATMAVDVKSLRLTVNEYKRRWLFWKRVKVVHQTISNDNPYAEIEYSEYIQIGKW